MYLSAKQYYKSRKKECNNDKYEYRAHGAEQELNPKNFQTIPIKKHTIKRTELDKTNAHIFIPTFTWVYEKNQGV